MKRFCYLLLMMALSATGFAQDIKKVRDKYFPNPELPELNTPIAHKRKGYTSYKEMVRFLKEQVTQNPGLISLDVAGHSQRGKEIYGVRIADDTQGTEKLRILYLARVHGDEPGGTEAMLHFIDRVTKEQGLLSLLDKIEIYIMPMVNVDGGESMTRQTYNGIDLNRDQVRIESPEAVAMRGYVNRIEPHVTVDFHEYQPLKSAYSLISSDILTVPWDVMFLTSGNPNVATPVRTAIDSLFLPQATALLNRNQFSTHTYYTPKKTSRGVVLNMGGSSIRSTSNTFALSNMYSILIEGRGIGLGGKGIKRRIQNLHMLATSFAQTSYSHKEELLAGLQQALEERKPVVVNFVSEKKEDCPVSFINQLKCRIDTVPMMISNAMASSVKESRPLPKKYYLLPTEQNALETLHKMGVKTEILQTERTLRVEAFDILSASEEGQPFRTFTPLKVKTRMKEKEITLPAGTIEVDTRQKTVRLLAALLEPESSNGFVNYRVIEVTEGEELPVYRSMNK